MSAPYAQYHMLILLKLLTFSAGSLQEVNRPELSQLINIKVLDWFTLGLHLGMNDYDLQVIRDNNPRDNKACKRTMFSEWLRRDSDATFKKLILALEKMCELSVASELRQKYGKIYV